MELDTGRIEPVSRLVRIPAAGVVLEGQLDIPRGARGVVLFAHGSGSSRHSPRNRFVASELRKGHVGTLLIDLLSQEEEAVDMRTRHLRFDIDLLANRVADVTRWMDADPDTARLGLGLFGASTGAAAALKAAAARPQRVQAVVSRGGRPDLAGVDLARVQAPTLLIVGSRDQPVIGMNEDAMRQMRCPVELELVAGATHLFEEPGTLEQAADLARRWFERHLSPT